MNNGSKEYLRQLCYKIRTSNFPCSNYADLAILLFNDTVRGIRTHLTGLQLTQGKKCLDHAFQTTESFLKNQRLISAVQVSILASTCGNLSSPGFQGPGGLKTRAQDIGSHPSPSMMVELHTLAAKAFADEMPNSLDRLDSKGASEKNGRP